jgi:2-desacetyl-2-hydroxyethyl bacteriochlorophyllide A dehydrogenase
MEKTAAFIAPKQIGVLIDEDAPLLPQQVRLKTCYSGISAGTELTGYRGTAPFMTKHWDTTQLLFVEKATQEDMYPRHFGYMEVGEVVAVGSQVTDIALGTRIYGVWSHKTYAVVDAEYARQRVMPAHLDTILGIFSQFNAIALNGIHDGALRIGETVVVFGMGVLGQIVAQLAKASGVTVIAVDVLDGRLQLAKELGADIILNPKHDKVAETVRGLTNGRGADVCFEVTGSTIALNEAIRTAAYSARVVAMGFFQGSAQGLYLGEEFHHNRINLVCSQIFGVAPDLKYRWDVTRLVQTGMRLQAEGHLNLKPLISHVKPFSQTDTLFRLLDETPEAVMQAVIDFSDIS